MMKNKVIVDLAKLPTSGHHRPMKYWTKVLTNVNKTKTNGYCFEGEFVGSTGRNPHGDLEELEVGTILLRYWDGGSRRYPYPNVALYRVEEDGSLCEIGRWEELPSRWALAVRDEIAEILAQQRGEPEQDELQRRINDAIELLREHGYTVAYGG